MAALAWALVLLGALLIYAGMTGQSLVSGTQKVLSGKATLASPS